MSVWFWVFLCFSFLGYLLEKAYAFFTHSPQQNRKCFILLPLCPVYGLAVAAILLLPPGLTEGWLPLVAASFLVPCAVEYLMHVYYEKLFRVRYWDYSTLPLQIHGRICLPFALIWTLLMPIAVRVVAPWLLPRLAAIPLDVTLALWLLLAADWLCSRYLLLRFADTELLSVGRILAENR